MNKITQAALFAVAAAMLLVGTSGLWQGTAIAEQDVTTSQSQAITTPDLTQGYPPCEVEDGVGCYWDASEFGNGYGCSFTTTPDGVIHYWDPVACHITGCESGYNPPEECTDLADDPDDYTVDDPDDNGTTVEVIQDDGVTDGEVLPVYGADGNPCLVYWVYMKDGKPVAVEPDDVC